MSKLLRWPFSSPRKKLALTPDSIPKPSLAVEKPQVVQPASETPFPPPPDLLGPRAPVRITPAVDVEAVGGVRPRGDMERACAGRAAAGAHQLPRGGLLENSILTFRV